MHPSSPAARLGLAVFLLLLCAAPATAASGWSLSKVAIEGEAAPGTADAFGPLFDVTVGDAGRVALGAPLASGFPAVGVWVDTGSGLVLRMRDGDAAPAPVVGTYLGFGAFLRLDASGRVSTSVLVDTGSSGVNGLFLDDAGVDATLVAEGDAAPTPPAGTLEVGLGDAGYFGVNAAGDVSFHSAVSGGTGARGIFVRSALGALSTVALEGDLAGAGPETFAGFGSPAIDDAGHVAFPADLAGGSAAAGLFLDAGSGPAALALEGDTAPNTGGATLVDFLYPALNVSGHVAFLSNLSGGTATGGLFVARPVVVPVVVENQAIVGEGTVTTVSSVPNLGDDGGIAMALGFASGRSGVYVHTRKGFDAVARDGEVAPDAGGALFASFGMVSRNDDGEVAFVATLDDGRTAAFVASPTATPQVPIPAAALLVLALGLVASVRRPLQRYSR